MIAIPPIVITIPREPFASVITRVQKNWRAFMLLFSAGSSMLFFWTYLQNGLGLAYNDARSHLDIGRRVVEGLKPGLAQLGSVWLPLPHLLMIPTIWVDALWHTGFSGAFVSMVSFMATTLLIDAILRRLGVSLFGRIVGTTLFISNLNILYLQSTAMTELLLLATMTAGAYYLLAWFQEDDILPLIKSAFFIMLSTLVRYDGWFLLAMSAAMIGSYTLKRKGWQTAEGMVVLFSTLAGFGIALWFLWNLLIFKDPFYFAFGPFSAYSQQEQLSEAGNLPTKGNVLFSTKIYLYALLYNTYTFPALLAAAGATLLWLDRRVSFPTRVASVILIAPLLFNIIALVLGHSVLFIQGISGNTWFNARYGVMMVPSIAVFVGYLVYRLRDFRWVISGLLVFVLFFALVNNDAVTIDDARVGSSQKNVSEVSGWLRANAKDQKGFILISAASHDAVIFSSGLPMKRFIHEGTGAYWESALAAPDRWARWLIMRTHDDNDLVYKDVKKSPGFLKYDLVASYPFADVYQLRDEFLPTLNTEPVFGKQK